MNRMRLDTLLATAAGRHAARAALAGERELSHSAFLAEARGVAGALREAGLGRDEPLHVRVSNHPLDLVAFFGAWLAGAVVRMAREAGLEAPANHVIYAALKPFIEGRR